MDNELNDLKRRAGITEAEQDSDMQAYDEFLTMMDSEYVFLGNLAQLISRAMAPNNARQVIGVISNRRDEMEKLSRDVKRKAELQKRNALV